MLTSYSRVTVVSGNRRVDLALPSSLPLSDVVPQVLRFCGPEEETPSRTEFTLGRLGGQSLSLSQSLAEAGVRDGDVIELRAYGEEARAAFVEDVRDTIEDTVDGRGGGWSTRSTAAFSLVAGSVFVLLWLAPVLITTFAAGLAGRVPVLWDTEAVVSALAAAAALIAGTALAARLAPQWAADVASSVAVLAACEAGVQIAGRSGGDLAAAAASGVALATVAAVLARLPHPRAAVLVAATVFVLAGSLIVLVGDELGAGDGVMVRVVALLAVLSIGIMPRVSIAVGGLSSADYRVRNSGMLSSASLTRRLRESQSLLLGAVLGAAILAGTIGYWLGLRPHAWSENLWDGLLSVSLAAGLLLRSRVFSRIPYMLPLRVAALGVLVAVIQQAVSGGNGGAAAWVPAAAAVAGLAALAFTAVPLSDVTRARLKRTLNLIEFIVVIDLIVVTMGAVALYDWVQR